MLTKNVRNNQLVVEGFSQEKQKLEANAEPQQQKVLMLEEANKQLKADKTMLTQAMAALLEGKEKAEGELKKESGKVNPLREEIGRLQHQINVNLNALNEIRGKVERHDVLLVDLKDRVDKNCCDMKNMF